MLRSLNILVAKILAVHYRNGRKAKNANLDIANSLEAELLLTKDACIIILFEEEQRLLLLLIIVFIFFTNYKEPIISTLESIKVVPITIIVHKSQGLILLKAVIDISNKKFTAGLSFVAMS
ncbi:16374_t:CDS:2 [Cetraspora pellucida]|uniref:16374_t:CDS:1 n=1 Tax=Cetraspora pellucida TaxID=1433469 RepID=A0A9N9FEM9_9GLOM|nr:16374_t:CDS:2 [Cetraspora pellucida]